MELIDPKDPLAGFKIIDGPLKDAFYLFKNSHSCQDSLKPGLIKVMEGQVSVILNHKGGKSTKTLGPIPPGVEMKLDDKKVEKLKRKGMDRIRFTTNSERACFKILYE